MRSSGDNKRKPTEDEQGKIAKLVKMTSNQHKTPVTLLQELAAKVNPRNLPVFTEVSEIPLEYEDTNMKFFIRCQALNYTSMGGGVTKKSAKHDAAERLLKKYCRKYDEDDDEEEEENNQANLDSNYITELLDYCTLKDFHKPEFICTLACGPSHAPSFTFQCTLDSIKRDATAENKKLAKQLSAKAVLEEIKNMSFPDLEKKLQKVDTKHIIGSNRQKVTNYRQLKQQDKVSKMGTLLKDRCEFFRKQDETVVNALRMILASPELDDQHKYEELLRELAENPLTQWQSKVEKFEDTELFKFELQIDFDKFTCVMLGATELDLCKEVLKYFEEMLREPEVVNIDSSSAFETVEMIQI